MSTEQYSLGLDDVC